MRNLTDLLKRFAQSLHQDTYTKDLISQTIFERVGVKVPLENLNLKNGVLELVGTPARNQAVKLKEEALKSELRERHKINILRILYK